MFKNGKHSTIAGKVKKLAVGSAIISLLVNGTVALFSMYWMQNLALQSTTDITNYASSEGESVVLGQSLAAMKDQVIASSQLAQVNLEKYTSYVRSMTFCAEGINSISNSAASYKMVDPPDPEKGGVLTMKRSFRDKDVRLEDVASEIKMYSKMEPVFRSIFENNYDVMGGIYLVTNSGIMISMDEYSDTMADYMDEDGEVYYDYTEAEWYKRAINSKNDGPIFSDAYQDVYDRGLTVTCAQRFRDSNGEIAGVMCIDLLMEDLIETVVELNTGDSYYGGIIDSRGNVIASPYIDYDRKELDNIIKDKDSPAHEVASSIMSGLTGIVQTSSNIYYAYAPIRLTDWTLFIEIDSDEVTKKMVEMHNTISEDAKKSNDIMIHAVFDVGKIYVVNLIIIGVASIVGATYLAKGITRPLTEIKDAVVNIRTKEIELDTNAEEEIAELAGAFNKLQSDLDDYIDELTAVAAKRERMGAELDVATRIQADLLPSEFPAFPERGEFELYATMTPAEEVGGDFYDFFLLDENRLALVMADVSDKGIPAALFMVISKIMIKNTLQQGLSPVDTMTLVNNKMCESNRTDMFVTVWLGVLDLSTGVMTCVNAGHEYPAIRKCDGNFELLKDKHGLVVGAMEGVPYTEYSIELNKGDAVFLYTDGVTEASDANKELFGFDRMLNALNKSNNDVNNILECVANDIEEFVNDSPQHDDITMMSIIYRGK